MTDTATLLILLGAIILLLAGMIDLKRKRQRKEPSMSVIIQEGRLPGENLASIVCTNCGRRFKLTMTFEGELLKCPYCGSVVR